MPHRALVTLITLIIASLCSACTGSGLALTFRNESGVPLFVSPVVLEASPHRELSSEAIAPGLTVPIPRDELEPMYYDPSSKLSVVLQFDWSAQYPVLLAFVSKHVVPLGEEGTAAANQPRLLAEYEFEIMPQSTQKRIEVRVGPVAEKLPVHMRQF